MWTFMKYKKPYIYLLPHVGFWDHKEFFVIKISWLKWRYEFFKYKEEKMKRNHKIAIIAIAHLAVMYTLAFLCCASTDGYTWLAAWGGLKILGISLGISGIVLFGAFLSFKWLEEEK